MGKKNYAIDLTATDATSLLLHLQWIVRQVSTQPWERLLALVLDGPIRRLHEKTLYAQPCTLKLSPAEAWAVQLALVRWPWPQAIDHQATLWMVQELLPRLPVRSEADRLPPALPAWTEEEE